MRSDVPKASRCGRSRSSSSRSRQRGRGPHNHRSTLAAMAVRIRDTLLRDTVELVPHEPGKLSIYVCGPTVYDVAARRPRPHRSSSST